MFKGMPPVSSAAGSKAPVNGSDAAAGAFSQHAIPDQIPQPDAYPAQTVPAQIPQPDANSRLAAHAQYPQPDVYSGQVPQPGAYPPADIPMPPAGGQPPYGTAPGDMFGWEAATPQKSQAKRGWIIALVIVVVLGLLVGGGFIFRAVKNTSTYGPEAKAREYLQAVVDGDVDTVVSTAAPNVTNAARALLNKDIYAASAKRPSDFSIDDTVVSGADATVSASVTLDGKSYPMTLTLHKTGTADVIFDAWQLTDGGLGSVQVASPESVTTVNGVAVSLSSGDEMPVLPGKYTFTPQKTSQYITFGDPVTISVVPGDTDTQAVAFGQSWTEAGRQYAVNAVNQRISGCLASDHFEPDGCKHLKMNDPGYAVTGITRTWSSAPTVTFKDGADTASSSNSGSFSFGSGSSNAWADEDLAQNGLTGSVVVSGGDLHIDYKWRVTEEQDWMSDTAVDDNVFSGHTVVAVTVGANGTPQLEFGQF